MKLVVLGHMPATAIELLRKIHRLGAHGEIEVLCADDIGITGKKAELVIVDELMFDPMNIREVIESLPEPIRAHEEYTDHRRRRSKGDRHRNKRDRWS